MIGARPIGYEETQIGWVGQISAMDMNLRITEAQDKYLRENPKMKVVDARMERVLDGAGVPHFNVYLGFAPIRAAAPPPNPRNLNNAPPPAIGGLPVDMIPLGMKETKF